MMKEEEPALNSSVVHASTNQDAVDALDDYVDHNASLGVDDEMARDASEHDYKALNLVHFVSKRT